MGQKKIFRYALVEQVRQRWRIIAMLALCCGFFVYVYIYSDGNVAAERDLVFLILVTVGPVNIVGSFRDSEIVVGEEGISARCFGITWKTRTWASVRCIYAIRALGTEVKHPREIRFLILGKEKDIFFPINFSSRIDQAEELIELLNRYSAKYKIKILRQEVITRVRPDLESGTVLDRLTLQ